MSITQQNNVFIDPDECGSSVGYYLTLSDYFSKKDNKTSYSLNGTVVLADCRHKFDWSFGEGNVDKIDAAIKMLQEFRKNYVAMEKQIVKLRG